MYDHGAFSLCWFLPDHLHKLEDALGSVGCGDAVVWPGSVVKMHHILHLISLMGEAGQQRFHRASTVKITLTHTHGFLSFCGFHFYPTCSLKKRSQPKNWHRTNRLFDYQVGGYQDIIIKWVWTSCFCVWDLLFSFVPVVVPYYFAFESRTVAFFNFGLFSSFYSIPSTFLILPQIKNNTAGKQSSLDSWEIFFLSFKEKKPQKNKREEKSLPGETFRKKNSLWQKTLTMLKILLALDKVRSSTQHINPGPMVNYQCTAFSTSPPYP